jgi:hypothetical protein
VRYSSRVSALLDFASMIPKKWEPVFGKIMLKELAQRGGTAPSNLARSSSVIRR